MDKQPVNEKINEEELKEKIAKSILPFVIYQLISNGILEEKDLSDRKLMIQKISANSREVIDNMRVHIVNHGTFLDACKSEFANGRPQSGVILASVCIENIVNLYYRDMLEASYSFKKKTIERIIELLSIQDKFGWFLKIAFDFELPEEIVAQVSELNALRNKIVHFKAVPSDSIESENGSFHQIENAVKGYTVERLETLIKSLEIEFEKARIASDQAYRLALETIEKEFS